MSNCSPSQPSINVKEQPNTEIPKVERPDAELPNTERPDGERPDAEMRASGASSRTPRPKRGVFVGSRLRFSENPLKNKEQSGLHSKRT